MTKFNRSARTREDEQRVSQLLAGMTNEELNTFLEEQEAKLNARPILSHQRRWALKQLAKVRGLYRKQFLHNTEIN